MTDHMLETKKQEVLREVTQLLAQEGLLPAELTPKDDKTDVDADAMFAALRERATSQIANFDTECIENDDDYAELLRKLGRVAGRIGTTSRVLKIGVMKA